MSKIDNAARKYMGDKERFADLFNFFMYAGEQVIKPDDLTEMDATEIALPVTNSGKSISVKKFRDMLSGAGIMTDGKAAYVILGLENQDKINYAMPIRNMLYDALQYSAQAEAIKNKHEEDKDLPSGAEYLSRFSKTDSVTPVITLVLYLGPGKWTGKRSLHQLFNTKDKTIKKYAQDYKLNLIAPGEMDEEEFKRFHTELGKLLFYIKYSDNKEYLKQKVEQNPEYRSVDVETVEFVNLVTNSKLTYEKGKDGKVDMCQAIEGIRNEGIEMGIEQGIEKGSILTLFNLVEKGAITIEYAADQSGMSVPEFEAKAKEYTEENK